LYSPRCVYLLWNVGLSDNAASLALHARHGFRVVGIRERPGRLHGVWRDVIAIERRSSVAGLD
jgi:L-amino acid N-acyltransferase YncA